MDDEQLLRYSRQIMLPELGFEGQQRLADSHALIIGLGGLGSPVALYLAAAGVGELTLVDDDQVDLSNLQRQVIHDSDSIGQPKVASAARRLAKVNPHCETHVIPRRLEASELGQRVKQADVVLDCSDNFTTRFMVNRLCAAAGTPLVSGAAIRWEGQLAVFTYGEGEACYQCIYGEGGEEDLRCSQNGVAAPLVGIIGSLQAQEALKLLSGAGEPLCNQLLVIDTLHPHWQALKLRPDPACPVCSAR
ncbi:MAG: molybdopterin-synthase adenylyltransferase MoeB [Gammaproteobacteria bacterium]|nr:MAG: molybdopterin-synthase adenylyltransferase MoeB [Gammaproteobacteria bacterium]